MSWRRDSTTPMDYEWQNSNGPIDANSPFITATQQASHKKRPHSVLDTPSKSFPSFNTPSRSQSYMLSPDHKPLPAVPPHVSRANTWEPRTPASVYDFSSGGETPNTPTLNEDSDIATPDTQMSRRMGNLMSDNNDHVTVRSRSPKKPSRRDSWFKSMFTSSPSPSKEKSAAYSSRKPDDRDRVKKRKTKRAKELAIYEEPDSPDVTGVPGPARGGPNAAAQSNGQTDGYAAKAAGFFGWIEAHPDLPAVLTFYLQLVVNACMGGTFLWIIWKMFSAIMADVNVESNKFMNEAMVEITFCAKQYQDNRCDPKTRVPAMETVCGNWEACMNRDARQIARASVGARTFASILNSFVEQLSYKSLLFTAIVIFGAFSLSNRFFDIVRSKTAHPHSHFQHNAPPPGDYFPPATPHRVPSGGYIDHQGYYTPYGAAAIQGTPYGMLASQSMPALPAPSDIEPVDSGTGTAKEARRSPRKKLWG